MKTSKIAEAVGYIDDDLITASIDYKPRKIRMKWLPYASVACAACLCIFAVRILRNSPGNYTGISSDSETITGGLAPASTPLSEITGNTNGAATSNTSADIIDSCTSSGENTGTGKPGDSTTGEKPGSSKPGNLTVSSVEKPGTGKPEDPVTSSGVKPNAYLITKPATFSTAKEQVKFTDVKEISGADFVGYELEYIMPSETLVALKYVYTDGYVSVCDNSGDWGKIAISPEWDEKIESDGMVFWKSTVTDPPAAIYISESDVAYYGMFESDADLSKAIDTIKSLI